MRKWFVLLIFVCLFSSCVYAELTPTYDFETELGFVPDSTKPLKLKSDHSGKTPPTKPKLTDKQVVFIKFLKGAFKRSKKGNIILTEEGKEIKEAMELLYYMKNNEAFSAYLLLLLKDD